MVHLVAPWFVVTLVRQRSGAAGLAAGLAAGAGWRSGSGSGRWGAGILYFVCCGGKGEAGPAASSEKPEASSKQRVYSL